MFTLKSKSFMALDLQMKPFRELLLQSGGLGLVVYSIFALDTWTLHFFLIFHQEYENIAQKYSQMCIFCLVCFQQLEDLHPALCLDCNSRAEIEKSAELIIYYYQNS